MPVNLPPALLSSPASQASQVLQPQPAGAAPSPGPGVSAAQVTQARQQAGEFMQALERSTVGGPLPWSGGGSHAAGNHQSLIALTGLMRDLMLQRAQGPAPMGAPRDLAASDLLKAGGATGLQLFLDVGMGFGAHQLITAMMHNHNLHGQPQAVPEPAGGAHNATAAAGGGSEPADIGSLFAGSNLLGFAAPSFVSGSAAYVAGHVVNALFDAPRTTGSPGSTTAARIGHDQAQNLLFNLPGMVGGFTAANLVLSAMKSPHPAAEWLLWSLGGGLGGALGGAMNLAYKCTAMGHKVEQPSRDWAEKTSQLKNLNFKEWTQFVVAHLASLTPIQFKGAASGALIPGDGYGQTLARRSANTMVLQGGFAALHGNVQKLVAGALELSGKLGQFCQDRGHLCHPRGDAGTQSTQINERLLGGARDLNDVAHNLQELLGVLRASPDSLGPLNGPLQHIEGSLARMATLQVAPPARNEQDAPATAGDLNRWHADAVGDLNQGLRALSALIETPPARRPAVADSAV